MQCSAALQSLAALQQPGSPASTGTASLPLSPQVTTFSRLLTSADIACLEREVQGKAQRPQLLFLQQFDTEYSFLKSIR